MEIKIPATIDEYIAGQRSEVQPMLQELRLTIALAAPDAVEKISWGMATFAYFGNLVHFSAEKSHIGFHPAPSAIEAFRDELVPYRLSKGTVRFPYDKPLPLDLIRRMVRFRVEEQASLAEAKREGKKEERPLRQRYPMPEDIARALERADLLEAYEARPPYQRNDYLGWISQAKRPETKGKRLGQMLEELREKDVYMGRPYQAKK